MQPSKLTKFSINNMEKNNLEELTNNEDQIHFNDDIGVLSKRIVRYQFNWNDS